MFNCRDFLEIDMTLSQDRVQQMTTTFTTHVNAYVGELRRLFLVEDIVDSVKFALCLWFMTYIGGWFNGMTVVIIGKNIRNYNCLLNCVCNHSILYCSIRRYVHTPQGI